MTNDSIQTTTSKRSEKIPIRSGPSSGNVYDRLYRTGTASSKIRKEVAPVKSKNILMRENEDPLTKTTVSTKGRPVTRRPKKPLQTKSVEESGAVFNRLYAKGTASSTSKRSNSDVHKPASDSSRVAMKPKNGL